MKKSTIFLWAYAAFLLLSVFICPLLSDNETLSQICIGATVAGYFFAVADFYEYRSEVQNQKMKIETKINALEKRVALSANDLIGLLGDSKTFAETAYMKSAEWNALLADTKDLECSCNNVNTGQMVKREKNKKYYTKCSGSLYGVGFFAFLIVTIFEKAYLFLKGSSDILTIMAFAIIILTYTAKETSNLRNKEEKDKLESLFDKQEMCDFYMKLAKERKTKIGTDDTQ